MKRAGMARRLLRLVAFLVPRERRADWLEEWEAELTALEDAGSATGDVRRTADRAGGYDPAAAGMPDGLPGRVRFVLGALPHAIWLRKEEWTMDSLLHDLRYAMRVLVRAPGFTAVAALTLALGIGTNATVFSLVNGLVLRSPAGVLEPDRLIQIGRSYEEDPRWDNWSWPAMQEIRESSAFEAVAGYQGQQFIIGSGPASETVIGEMVTGNAGAAPGAVR